jgi:hypothetical protein
VLNRSVDTILGLSLSANVCCHAFAASDLAHAPRSNNPGWSGPSSQCAAALDQE